MLHNGWLVDQRRVIFTPVTVSLTCSMLFEYPKSTVFSDYVLCLMCTGDRH